MMRHIPVLLDEVCALFEPIGNDINGVFIDCTLGLGGHSQALLARHKNITLIGIDKDTQAIAIAKQNLKNFSDRVQILQGGFGYQLEVALHRAFKSQKKVVGILADIGVSSLQLDSLERGFSFKSENLDMRMDTNKNLDAHYILCHYSQFELERVFREYGEIKEYKKLARLLKSREFASAKDLSAFLSQHFSNPRINPATLAFQALRIEVNDELGELKRFFNTIAKYFHELSGAIVDVISFHSLEDRITKETFREWSKSCICDPNAYRCECGNNHAKGRILTKKPITPSQNELRANPRSRSSKLRAFVVDKT